MMITNLTTKFNRGQEERKKNGQQNQTIINAGKIPELAKAVRELENEFTQNQRKKNAQNIKNAQEKAKKAETNRNQAQIQSKKYKEQSEKYKKRKNALVQNIKKVVETRNAARKGLEKAKENLATASTQSEKVQIQAKANLEAARKAAKAAQNELAKSKNASKLANKKRELTNLAREQRVLQNLAPNGLTPNGIGPRRPFSTIINGLTVNDLANGGLAGKLPNQIKATGTVKKANQAKREEQKASVIKSIKNAQNASKAKEQLRQRLNRMKTIITEKRKANEVAKAKANEAAKAKENRIKKECESNPYLKQCEGASDAREKAGKKKAYKQNLTKLLNTYNTRLGSLVDAKGNPSWPVKKNELFEKYAKKITNDKVIKAELNSMTKIHDAKTTGQRKKEITKLLNSYNNRLGSKKWPETKGTLLNEYMKSTKNLEQDKANLEALLKRKVKNAANNLAAKKVANNLATKSAAATKIQAKVRGGLIKVKFAEYKPLKTKLESNSKLPRNEKQRLMNMLIRSYTNQDRDKFREVRKMIENKNQQQAVSKLVAGAIKKATNNELVNTRLAYRTNVLVATREGRLPQNQKTYWYDQATTATTMNMIKGVDKMFKIHLEN